MLVRVWLIVSNASGEVATPLMTAQCRTPDSITYTPAGWEGTVDLHELTMALDEWKLSDEAKEALLARDYNRLLDLGGNVYFLSKLFSTDGLSFAEAVSTMTDMTFPEYREMMNNGGRSPIGNRSIKGGY